MGITEGTLTAGEGASLAVTTAAAEKVYRAQGPAAEVNIALKVADGARLSWLPQEPYVLVLALLVGLVAALLPAIQAYRTDIAAVLASRA